MQTQQVLHSPRVVLPVESAQTIFAVGDQQGLAERRPYSIERQALTRDGEQANLPKDQHGTDIDTVTLNHPQQQTSSTSAWSSFFRHHSQGSASLSRGFRTFRTSTRKPGEGFRLNCTRLLP